VICVPAALPPEGRSGCRHVARLFVPRHLGPVEMKLQEIYVLDLSPAGVRIEHREPLHEGSGCYVDLPPVLGRLRLTGQVVWTRPHKGEQTYEGESRVYYQSVLPSWASRRSSSGSWQSRSKFLRRANDPPERAACSDWCRAWRRTSSAEGGRLRYHTRCGDDPRDTGPDDPGRPDLHAARPQVSPVLSPVFLQYFNGGDCD
jgi:hypothetical protein